MADSRILARNLLRSWTEVFFGVIGKAEESTLLVGNACRMLLVKFVGWVLVL
jgi:hypothetical protein